MFFAGIDKFRSGSGLDTTYSMANYKEKMGLISETVAANSVLPGWMCNLYAMPLGFLLVGFGVMVLLGIFTRLSLFVSGLLFVSLAFGVMVLPDDFQALLIGLHVAIVAFALTLTPSNCFSLDYIFNRKK